MTTTLPSATDRHRPGPANRHSLPIGRPGGVIRPAGPGAATVRTSTGSRPSCPVPWLGLVVYAGCLALSWVGLVVFSVPAHGFPGQPDPTFTPAVQGVDQLVKAMTLQPDGKILVGGKFRQVKGLGRTRIARLLADGTGDPTFDPGTGPDDDVSALALLPDGKIIIAGEFQAFGDLKRGRIARLRADGSLDTSFDPGTGANDEINTLALQPDGKILIGGWFSHYNGAARRSIARLHPDGALDLTFDPGEGPDGQVSSIAVQPDGRLVIGGEFVRVGTARMPGVARLEPNGRLDPSFSPSRGTDGEVYSVSVQSDGRVWAGGRFSEVNNLDRYGVARLLPDGSHDPTFFAQPSGVASVRVLRLHPDGGVIVGGAGVARLDDRGVPVPSFGVNQGPLSGDVRAISVQADGRVVVAGWFSVTPAAFTGIIRLMPDGSPDPSFQAGTTLRFDSQESIQAMLADPDGGIMVGGNFSRIGVVPRAGLARLRGDGTVDPAFDPGVTNRFAWVYSMLRDANGLLVVAGSFSAGDGRTYVLTRWEADGTLDPSFEATKTTFDGVVVSMALTSDSRLIVAGPFTRIGNTVRNGIARLLADGRLDESFGVAGGPGPAGAGISRVAVQPDGQVLVAGSFTSFRGLRRNGLCRLNADGTVDTTFVPNTRLNTTLSHLLPLGDGRILAIGSLVQADGTSRQGIYRFLPDGTLDSSFVLDPTIGNVRTMALDRDGRIVVGGLPNLDPADKPPFRGVARVGPDGARDTTFDPHPVAFNSIGPSALAIQRDGRVLAAGGTMVVVKPVRYHSYITRLLGEPGTEVAVGQLAFVNGRLGFDLSAVSPRTVTVERSTDFVQWTPMRSIVVQPAPTRFEDPDQTSGERRLYRVVWQP